MNDLTLVVPYYRNPLMLKRQVEEWKDYPLGVKVICVDDGSPEPALPIIAEALYPWGAIFSCTSPDWRDVQLYRIGVDLSWNREGARNLGAYVATTDWIIQIDIDHVLSSTTAEALLDFIPDLNRWYRFPRWRVGKADETRRKDKIAADVEYGEIHPHGDSYMVRRDVYWQTGGYDEDYAGCLGGGGAFLRRLEELQPVELLPAPIRLEVYTRDVIKDASDWSLSRDTSEWHRRRKKKQEMGDDVPKNPLRFPWKREL